MISPGNNVGTLTIAGNLTEFGAAALNLTLGGTASGQFDRLFVTGQAILNGALNLNYNYTPAVGDTLPVVVYASHTGEFSSFSNLNFSGGSFQTSYNSTNFTLTAAKAAVRVLPTTALLTSKAGDATSFSVALATQPTGNVSIAVSSSNTAEGTVSIGQLVFTPSNFSTAQTVTVTGQNDGHTGDVAYSVVLAAAVSSDPNYNGLNPADVSVTNRASEVRSLQVSSLAVAPSSGLQSSQVLNISWNDVNAGNVPAAVPWTDQIVITDTTTGAVLVADVVPYNTNVNGPVAAGASSALQQYSLILPDGLAGVGNIQVSVTTDIGHAFGGWNNNLVNADLRNYGGGSNYPIGPTVLNVGGVDFSLVAGPAGGAGIIQTPEGNSSFDIRTHVVGATTIYTLINSAFGQLGDTIGSVEFKGANGSDTVFALTEGTNIRDQFNGNFNNTIAPGTPSASFGNGAARLDMQTFVLPSSFATDTLTDIIFSGINAAPPQGQPLLAAVTVKPVSGPVDFIPLGSGAPVADNNSSTINVTSTLAPYPDLQVTNVAVTPSAGLQSGSALTISWNDINTGNGSTPVSWTDHIVITNQQNGAVILDTMVPYDAGAIGPLGVNGSAARQFAFTLPDGAVGASSFTVAVTVNGGNNFFEFNAGGTGETNNTSSTTFASTLPSGFYPDLHPTNLTISPPALSSGARVTVSWNDVNSGTTSVPLSAPLVGGSSQGLLGLCISSGGRKLLRPGGRADRPNRQLRLRGHSAPHGFDHELQCPLARLCHAPV